MVRRVSSLDAVDMLALRSVRTARLSFVRRNATVAATGAVDAPSPLPPTTSTEPKSKRKAEKAALASASGEIAPTPTDAKTQGRRKPGRTLSKRPQISLENPREWKRPIAFGVLPAYDEALRYIMKDSSNLKKEAEELKASIEAEEKSSNKDEASLETKRKKLAILEVQSEINIPAVRWKVANGMGKHVPTCYLTCIEPFL